MEIPFTQYLMPDGRTKEITTTCPEELEQEVQKILNSGAVFEIEMLTTGDISMTVEKEDTEGNFDILAHEICGNGPEIEEAITNLIKVAAQK